MIRKTRVFLVCAALFTFATAQSSTFGTYDIGPYSSGSGDDSGSNEASAAEPVSDGDAEANAASAEKRSNDKKARSRRTVPSFSSAFSGPQKSCPVCSSVRLKSNQYVDYSGGRIHTCSAACISRVRRNPSAFADILAKRGEQLSTP